MSNKATSAVNQQGSLRDPSETTRRAPFSQKAIKAYLLGALHDATFSSNRRYRFSQKGTEWLKFLQKLFKKVGYNSWIYKEGSDRDIYVLETLASFLDFSFNPRRLSGINEKVSYIRGFFDAEGGIPHNKEARFYIQLVQKNKQKLVEIKRILSELNIDVGKIHNPSKKVDPDLWRIYILSNSKERFGKKDS
jgi:intein-encoded DNA endonuclease-like protein